MEEKIKVKIFSFFDFVLPRTCLSCKKKLTLDEEYICSDCLQSIKKTDDERLKFEYDKKFAGKKIITDFFTQYIFEKDKTLQLIIHAIKYDMKFMTATYLGKLLGAAILEKRPKWKIDYVMPIPLHRLREAEREYNQCENVAKGISRVTSIPVMANVMKRVKFTESQTTKALVEREENVKNAFQIKKKSEVKNKNILLIDDVITTGATINECGKVLIEAGANKVYAASLALAD
jgi:ComF family protein